MTSADCEYPPGSWTETDVREALAETDGESDLPTCDDAARWSAIASDPALEDLVHAIRDRAERHSGDPVPPLPASEFADFVRTGDRSRYQRRYFGRHRRLSLFALAECIDRDGAYLDDVLDVAWAVCEQTTWLLPAHLPDDERRDGLPDRRDPPDRHVALFSARTAHLLAEVDRLLGERLNPALRERIRSEVDERVLTPFESRDDFHWREPPTGNWSAVCNGAAVLAALSLEDDPDRLAKLVVKGVRSLETYLDSFGADGCPTEGLSYWNLGLGHYVMLASALAARTDGRLSLLSPPILRETARFPLRIALSPGRHVPFSDARETDDVDPYLACRLGEAFEIPALVASGRRSLASLDGPFGQRTSDNLVETVRTLLWCHDCPANGVDWTPPRRFLFEDAGWWIARADPGDPDGLVVAAKAGHNDEHHNHNDCGSFVVHYRRESPLADLGFGTYDRDYFGDRRYEYLVARSLGHSVPVVNGYEQAAGREFAASVVERESVDGTDRFAVELADCYPETAGVASLRRSLALDRSAGRVTVEDVATFDDAVADPTLESVFVSYVPIETTESGLRIAGERSRTEVRFEPTADRVTVERLEDAVDVSSSATDDTDCRDVWRARVTPPVESGETDGESDGTVVASRARIDPGPAE